MENKIFYHMQVKKFFLLRIFSLQLSKIFLLWTTSFYEKKSWQNLKKNKKTQA